MTTRTSERTTYEFKEGGVVVKETHIETIEEDTSNIPSEESVAALDEIASFKAWLRAYYSLYKKLPADDVSYFAYLRRNRDVIGLPVSCMPGYRDAEKEAVIREIQKEEKAEFVEKLKRQVQITIDTYVHSAPTRSWKNRVSCATSNAINRITTKAQSAILTKAEKDFLDHFGMMEYLLLKLFGKNCLAEDIIGHNPEISKSLTQALSSSEKIKPTDTQILAFLKKLITNSILAKPNILNPKEYIDFLDQELIRLLLPS